MNAVRGKDTEVGVIWPVGSPMVRVLRVYRLIRGRPEHRRILREFDDDKQGLADAVALAKSSGLTCEVTRIVIQNDPTEVDGRDWTRHEVLWRG